MDYDRLERLLSALHRTDNAAPVLQRLCFLCVDHVGADGASVTAVGDGIARVLNASDNDVATVAALQIELRDGPCLDAIATVAVVAQPDLTSIDALTNWPRFAPAAHRHGVGAAFAYPLVMGRNAVGSLDLYNRTTGPLGAHRSADVSMIADLAALAIGPPGIPHEIDDVGISVEPRAPWAHPAIVHNACGMVSQQLGISVDDALLRLRAFAFAQNSSVASLARAIVNREVRIDPWTSDD